MPNDDTKHPLRMTTRRCMMCKLDKLKGFFRHRTDPLCMDCTEDLREQRRLLQAKWRQEDRDARAAARHAEKGL